MFKKLKYKNVIYNNYVISENGIIKNLQTNKIIKNTLVEPKECSKRQAYYCAGVRKSNDDKFKNIIVHRAVAETFINNPNNYKYVVFIDGNSKNLSVKNLMWSNHKNNDDYVEQSYNSRNENTKKYITNKRREIKIKAVEYKGGKCEVCGYNKCMTALEFHHLDPSNKSFSISSKFKSWDNIVKELEKCVLVCSNCHREIESGLKTIN